MGIFIGDREFVFSSPAVHGLDCNELPSGISYVANATNAPNDSNDYFLVQTILSSGGGVIMLTMKMDQYSVTYVYIEEL